MLTEKQALEKAQEVIRSSRSSRAYWDSIWALNMAYASGQHWTWATSQPGGSRAIKRLHNILDPQRADVRVTLDVVSQNVRRMVAALKPQKLPPIIHQRGGTPEAMTAKHVFTGLLQDRMRDIRALPIWRGLHMPRCVLGSMCVRRQITTTGRPATIPLDYGGTKAKPLALKRREVSWSAVLPFSIIRDPAAMTLDPAADESVIGQETPRSTDWVKRNFGITIETEATLGNLRNHLDQLRRVCGWPLVAHAAESNQPGVLVYDFFFQDADSEDPWTYELLAYMDPSNPQEPELKKLHFGKNPFYGLPLHFIHYESRIIRPWAAGMPELMKPAQDVRNMAATAMLRVMIDHYPKWRIPEGSVDNISSALMNRTDHALEYKWTPGQPPPDRVSAPAANPVSEAFLQSTADDARAAANISPVQMGELSSRHSGEAYQTQAQQADVPLNDLRKDDELVLNELLYGTLIDTVEIGLRPRRDVARKLLGEQFDQEQIRIALSRPARELIQSVEIVPDALRHKPPKQVQDDFTNMVERTVIAPRDAQYEMLIQADIVTDSIMAEGYRQQEMELAMLLAGQPVEVDAGQDHSTSLRVLKQFQSSTRWHSLAPEQRDRVARHWAAHKNAEMQLAQWAQGYGQDENPQARGSAPASGNVMASGSVGPAGQVA